MNVRKLYSEITRQKKAEMKEYLVGLKEKAKDDPGAAEELRIVKLLAKRVKEDYGTIRRIVTGKTL